MFIESKCAFCGADVVRKKQAKDVKFHFCNLVCKSEWQRSQKPYDKAWLTQKYIVEQLSANDIARMVNRDPKRVWEWIRDYGIPTRPRGSFESNHFVKGQPSAFLGRKHSDANKEIIRQRRMADGHVPYLKNGVHHLKGKRGADTPRWKGGITPERAAFYSSDEWKCSVKHVWSRDNAICQRCGLDHRTIDRKKFAFDIHHIEGFENVEKRADVNNLVLLCETCHYFVHSRKNINKEFLK